MTVRIAAASDAGEKWTKIRLVLRVPGLHPAQQDVGIDEDAHPRSAQMLSRPIASSESSGVFGRLSGGAAPAIGPLRRRRRPFLRCRRPLLESVARLLAGGEPAHYTLQNLAEFWNALTRPAANNGLGLSVVRAEAEITGIEETLTLLPDAPEIYAEWRRLVTHHAVLGTKVHDARLVAAMNVHGVLRILTFNAGDFARYGVEVLQPG